MALSLRNPRAEELARELARRTGTTMTDAILGALEEKLGRLEGAPVMDAAIADVMSISRRCSELPTLDSRTDEEILGYGSKGV